MTDNNVTTTYRQALESAQQLLRATVAAVPAELWTTRTPCELWNTTQVLQHSAGDQLAYATSRVSGALLVDVRGPLGAVQPAQRLR